MTMPLPVDDAPQMDPAAPPLFELRGISKKFPGVKALDDRLAWIDPATGLVVETPEETGEAR